MNKEIKRYVTVDGNTFVETYASIDSKYPIRIDLVSEGATKV
jgi:hypothetical protein